MKYDSNRLLTAAQGFRDEEQFGKAIRIYLFLGDGDPSLDGGFLAGRLGECYEALGELMAAKYWFGRAVEENPKVRILSSQRRQALAGVDVSDIVSDYILRDR